MGICFSLPSALSSISRSNFKSRLNFIVTVSRNSPANIRLDEDVFRRLKDILIKTNMFVLALRLQKTSWSRPIYSSWPFVFKTSSRRFEDVFKTSCKNVFKTSSRRLQDVLKTSSRHLQDVSPRHLQDVLKNFFKISSRRLQDVLKTSSKHL